MTCGYARAEKVVQTLSDKVFQIFDKLVWIPVVAEAICSIHSSTDQNVCMAASCDAQQDARTAASDE